MVGPIDVKQGASVDTYTGWTMEPWPLAALMTLTFDFSQGQI